MPQLVEFLDRLPRLVDPVGGPESLDGRQSPGLDEPMKGVLRARRSRRMVQRRIAESAPVEDDLELAPGDLAGVKLLDCSGGEVARIGEWRLAGLLALVVDALEFG